MGSAGVNLIIILILVLLNGVLAMAEMAMVTANRVRLGSRADSGSRGARVAIELMDSPSRFLSTVQVGITLIGILAGAFGGVTLAVALEDWMDGFGAIEPVSGPLSIAIVVLFTTYLTLVIGELAPKQIALYFPETVASILARPMQMAATAAAPAVYVLSTSTDWVLRLAGFRSPPEAGVTEEEIRVLLGQGVAAGTLEEADRKLAISVLDFGDLTAGELMTPRHDLVWTDIEQPAHVNRQRMIDAGHSYYPVARGHLDELIGIVAIKELWATDSFDLEGLAVQPLFVPEAAPAGVVMDTFKQAGRHRALVIDEYGAIQGMITLHDLMEAIVGELDLITSPSEQPAIRREDGSWLLDGALPVHELRDLLALGELPGEREGRFQTIAGFVMYQLGRVPLPSDSFRWQDWRFEVMDMDGRRIDKVLAVPQQPTGDADEPVP